jgi:predicted RNA binding protein YcfA (HicA-like mRNA interferase family)
MPISGKKVVKMLKKSGWEIISQTGSHVKLRKGNLITHVPVHGNKDLGKGLIKAIEKQTKEKIL